MRTIAVVDVIKQYLMTFGPLLVVIKKRVLSTLSLDRLTINKNYSTIVIPYEKNFSKQEVFCIIH